MTTQYEKQKARRIYETLRSNPQTQAEKIAEHYLKLANGALDLREMLIHRNNYGSTSALEESIATAVECFRAAHLADFGIELEWEHFRPLD